MNTKDRKNLEKYLKWADVLILVFSIIDCQTFTVIQDYMESICDLIKKNTVEETSADRVPTKLILLGNKLDLDRYRQVPRQDIDSLIDKYGNWCSSNVTNKLVSNETNHALITDNCLVSLNLTYMETTSCEEYELVQNLFHKIIRDVRRERETHHLVNPLQICEDNYSNSSASNSLNSKLKSKSSSSYNSSSTLKRSKSPKHNSFNIIQDANNQNLSGSHSQLTLGSHASNGNSLSANNFQTLSSTPAVSSAAAGSSTAATSASSSNGGGTSKEINKKNSSKFPFFTKILNKS
jgi:hypothetical protein